MKKLVEIFDGESDIFDCDCCGCYSMSEFSVSITDNGNVTAYNHYHDGHFGNGDWDGEEKGRWLLALKDILEVDYLKYEDKYVSWGVGGFESCNGQEDAYVASFSLSDDYKSVKIVDKNDTVYLINVAPSILDDEYFYDGGDTSNIVRYAVQHYCNVNNIELLI